MRAIIMLRGGNILVSIDKQFWLATGFLIFLMLLSLWLYMKFGV